MSDKYLVHTKNGKYFVASHVRTIRRATNQLCEKIDEMSEEEILQYIPKCVALYYNVSEERKTDRMKRVFLLYWKM